MLRINKLLPLIGCLLVFCFPTCSDASIGKLSSTVGNKEHHTPNLRSVSLPTGSRDLQTYTYKDNGDGTVSVETSYSPGVILLSWLIPVLIIIAIVIASCSCCRCCIWYPYMCCASPEEKEEILRRRGKFGAASTSSTSSAAYRTSTSVSASRTTPSTTVPDETKESVAYAVPVP